MNACRRRQLRDRHAIYLDGKTPKLRLPHWIPVHVRIDTIHFANAVREARSRGTRQIVANVWWRPAPTRADLHRSPIARGVGCETRSGLARCLCAGQKSRPPRSSQHQPSLFSAMQRIRMLSLCSEKPISQRRSNTMLPSHSRQATSDTAAAVATSAWQLAQRRIEASQEIVVTTTTLKLRISGCGCK